MDREFLIHLRCWFDGYCKTFYTSDEDDQRNIALKEQHTRNVCADMAKIAGEELLPDEQAATAEAIALLHDVGRFEQYRRHKSFNDSRSLNHAALGAQVIRECGVLAGVPENLQRIILNCVALHNVFAVPEGIAGEERMFLHLIRDADKLDIWRVFLDYYAMPPDKRASAVSLGFPDVPEYTPGLVEHLLKREMINLSQLKTLNDFKLLQLSWVYDLNFRASLRMAAERNYVELLGRALPADGLIREGLDFVAAYLRARITDPGTET